MRLLSDGRFWQDSFQTGRFALMSVSLELLLALAIALLLDHVGAAVVRSVLSPFALGTSDHNDGVGLALDLQHPLRTT